MRNHKTSIRKAVHRNLRKWSNTFNLKRFFHYKATHTGGVSVGVSRADIQVHVCLSVCSQAYIKHVQS
jgi:hypothetical protein